MLWVGPLTLDRADHCQAPVLVEGWLSGVEGLGGRFGSSGDGGLVGLAEGLRGEAAEREMGPEGVEPVDPFRGRDLDVVDALPGAEVPDDLRFEQRVQSLGQCIVIGIAARADRGDRVLLGQRLPVADRSILDSSIGVMHEPAEVGSLASAQVDCHVQGIESEIGVQRARRSPAHDLPVEHVGDERDVDPSGERVDVGDVRDPQLVRRERAEMPVHQI